MVFILLALLLAAVISAAYYAGRWSALKGWSEEESLKVCQDLEKYGEEIRTRVRFESECE